jgi:hypothetical protein
MSWSLPAAAQGIASSISIADGFRHYDVKFVLWCILVSVVGGLGHTVLTLLSTEIEAINVFRSAWKDLAIAALAGCVAAISIYALHSIGINIPVPLTILILGACGWARMGFFVWANDATKSVANRVKNRLADSVGK